MTTPNNAYPFSSSATLLTTGAAAGCFKVLLDSFEYHMDKDVPSCSMLKEALVSPAHYLEAITNIPKRSDAKDYGTILHMLVLEPKTQDKVVAIYPGHLGSDAISKAFKEMNSDRICIGIAEFAQIQIAALKLLESKFRGRSLYKFVEEGEPETTIYYTDPILDISCRIRMDLYHPDFTFDLKSTRRNTPNSFIRDAIDMHYDLQAYMYSLGRLLLEGGKTPKEFVFVAQESCSPNSTFILPSDVSVLENGQKKYNRALGTIAACRNVDSWPSPSGEFPFVLNHWDSFKEPLNFLDVQKH